MLAGTIWKPTRFSQFREAIPPPDPSRRGNNWNGGDGARSPIVQGLADDISEQVDGSDETDSATYLLIDRQLDSHVWAGTRFEDRVQRSVGQLNQSIHEEVTKSLLAQERYEDFRDRMRTKMGIDKNDLSLGVLGNLTRQIASEAKVGWNEAMLSVNQQVDTVEVWDAVMDDATTPGCEARHGLTRAEVVEQFGDDQMPQHIACRCQWLTTPSVNSIDPEWAAMGQAAIDDLRSERDDSDLSEAASPLPWPSQPQRRESFAPTPAAPYLAEQFLVARALAEYQNLPARPVTQESPTWPEYFEMEEW